MPAGPDLNGKIPAEVIATGRTENPEHGSPGRNVSYLTRVEAMGFQMSWH